MAGEREAEEPIGRRALETATRAETKVDQVVKSVQEVRIEVQNGFLEVKHDLKDMREDNIELFDKINDRTSKGFVFLLSVAGSAIILLLGLAAYLITSGVPWVTPLGPLTGHAAVHGGSS